MKVKVLVTLLCPTLCDPRTLTSQAPLSMEFSRQEYWCGLPFPSPRNLSDPGVKPRCPTLQADSLPSEPPGELQSCIKKCYKISTHYHPDLSVFFRLQGLLK